MANSPISARHAATAIRCHWHVENSLHYTRDVTFRIEDAIADVIKWSRWRRMGHRLRLAKRLSWETGNWRTDLNEAPAGSAPNTDGRKELVAKLLVELERMNKLLDHMRLSRWRKLGHWLGLVERLPWESGTWRDPLLLKPFPAEEAGLDLGTGTMAATSHFNYCGFAEYANECFLGACRSFATDVILDVGANTGQFAKGLRTNGYHGHIISFEPLSEAHSMLASAAASDPLWDVVERCAVGASATWTAINIAGNSYSSSLLPMLDLHREAAPESAYQGTEPCHVITLELVHRADFLRRNNTIWTKNRHAGVRSRGVGGPQTQS